MSRYCQRAVLECFERIRFQVNLARRTLVQAVDDKVFRDARLANCDAERLVHGSETEVAKQPHRAVLRVAHANRKPKKKIKIKLFFFFFFCVLLSVCSVRTCVQALADRVRIAEISLAQRADQPVVHALCRHFQKSLLLSERSDKHSRTSSAHRARLHRYAHSCCWQEWKEKKRFFWLFLERARRGPVAGLLLYHYLTMTVMHTGCFRRLKRKEGKKKKKNLFFFSFSDLKVTCSRPTVTSNSNRSRITNHDHQQ